MRYGRGFPSAIRVSVRSRFERVPKIRSSDCAFSIGKESAMQQAIERIVKGFERGELSRRQLIGKLTALVAAASVQSSPAQASPEESTFRAVDLNHLALRVADIPETRDFYQRHLGMEVMSQSASSCFMSCGKDFVAFFRRSEPGMDHYCYSVEGYTVRGAAEKLRSVGIEPRIAGNRIYFPDPDGLIVQLAAPGFRA